MTSSNFRQTLSHLVTIFCLASVAGCLDSSTATRQIADDGSAPPSVKPIVMPPEPATTPTVSTEESAEDSIGTSKANDDNSMADDDSMATESQADGDAPSMKVRPRSRVRAGGILDLTFDDVEFKIEKDADFERPMLTAEIEAMHGKEVVIRGFILESYQLKNIKEFVLVRDNQECCFGPGAYIYHNMQVEMVGDARAEYSLRPITVRGIFSIKPWIGPDDKCYSVYHIAATSFEK